VRAGFSIRIERLHSDFSKPFERDISIMETIRSRSRHASPGFIRINAFACLLRFLISRGVALSQKLHTRTNDD
jgi:hypothetical protein